MGTSMAPEKMTGYGCAERREINAPRALPIAKHKSRLRTPENPAARVNSKLPEAFGKARSIAHQVAVPRRAIAYDFQHTPSCVSFGRASRGCARRAWPGRQPDAIAAVRGDLTHANAGRVACQSS